MIPKFPEFKDIELSDKTEVDEITIQYPPYSDFEFGSLWAWNTQSEIQLSKLNDNLVVKFSDYVTGEPFLSFLGENKPLETINALLAHAESTGLKPHLKLIPEIAIRELLQHSGLKITEDRDHFDYIYFTGKHIKYEGRALKKARNQLNAFIRRYPNHQVRVLDLSNKEIQVEIKRLCKTWEKNKGTVSGDTEAFERFINHAEHFTYLSVGIYIDNTLVAFNINVLLPGRHSNCLFAKADTKYHGVYSVLMHETAKILQPMGYPYMNYEQDLGIIALRNPKMDLQPTEFLKKYHIVVLYP